MKRLFLFFLWPVLFLSAEETSAINQLPAQVIVHASNSFAFEFYSLVKNQEKTDFVFSPYSLLEGFSMLELGSSGASENTLESMTGVPPSFLSQFQHLDIFLRTKANGNAFLMANQLWVLQGIEINPAFKKKFESSFKKPIKQFFFDSAANQANDWTAYELGYAPNRGVQKNDLTEGAKLFLTSAASFKGTWKIPFESEKTDSLSFEIEEGRIVKALTMETAGLFHYHDDGINETVAIPYESQNQTGPLFHLVIIKPKTPKTIFDTEITLKGFEKTIESLKVVPARLKIPRYSVNSFFNLKSYAKELSVQSLFEKGADFSEIKAESDIFLSYASHQAAFRVEEGYGPKKRVNDEEKGLTIAIDRPFFFFVYEQKSGAILLMGRIQRP